MRELLGEIRTDIVPNGIRKKRNENNSWEYGYNKEYDIVIVSKDGTLGQIYELSGIRIGIPEVPKDKTKIINHDLPQYKQKWKRQEMPKGLREDNKEKYYDYIVEEFRRRKEGVFIYINGEIEYFSGSYYFFLEWFAIGRIYPHFRYTQKELMLFWEACYADQRCYGILYVKNRRLGWSTMQQSECNNRGTIYREGLIGIISKTGKDAKSAFRKVVQGFKRLPFFFKPQTDGTDSPKSELAFTKPAKRITHKTSADYSDDEALNTFITWYNTDLNSMDSERIAPIQIIDEPGKFPTNVPFSEYWEVAKECLVEGDEIVGKAMVGSTIEAPERGGREFEIVWDHSDVNNRDGNDQTVSGLYRIFIPAEYNIRGFFDEFGYPILEDPETPIKNNEGKLKEIGAIRYLNNKEDALKHDPDKLASRKRKYPRTIIDAFRSANTDCRFNAQKLYDQLDWINQEMNPALIQVGDLTWVDGIQDGEVKFTPNPSGRWKIAWQPSKELRNKYENTPRGKKPLNAHLGAFGCDPYNRGKTADGRGSNGSIHGLTKNNMQGVPSRFFFLEYLARPPKVEIFYEDMIKAMVYYSMPAAIEQSNDDFLKYLKARGYRPFVLTRPGVAFKDLNPTEQELGGIPAQGNKIGDAQFYAIEAFIDDYVGRASSNKIRPIGEIGEVYFHDLVEQWLKVDPDKRTKFDAYISSSLAAIVTQPRIQTKKTTQSRPVSNPLTTYDNSSSISKRSTNEQK
jgi:hypothetical protein